MASLYFGTIHVVQTEEIGVISSFLARILVGTSWREIIMLDFLYEINVIFAKN